MDSRAVLPGFETWLCDNSIDSEQTPDDLSIYFIVLTESQDMAFQSLVSFPRHSHTESGHVTSYCQWNVSGADACHF